MQIVPGIVTYVFDRMFEYDHVHLGLSVLSERMLSGHSRERRVPV